MINVILVRHLNEIDASSEILASVETLAQARRFILRRMGLGKRQPLTLPVTWMQGRHGYALRVRAQQSEQVAV